MLQQIVQIGIAIFAGGCTLMVLRTVSEALPELLAIRDSGIRHGAPVPVPVESPRARSARHEI